jgi:predicted transcriptional regulator
MAKTTQDDDGELIQQTFRLPRGLIRRMKVHAAMNDTTQQLIVTEAVTDYLEREAKAAGKR